MPSTRFQVRAGLAGWGLGIDLVSGMDGVVGVNKVAAMFCKECEVPYT